MPLETRPVLQGHADDNVADDDDDDGVLQMLMSVTCGRRTVTVKTTSASTREVDTSVKQSRVREASSNHQSSATVTSQSSYLPNSI